MGRILALPRSAGFQACCIAGFQTCATFAYHGRVRCDLSPWAARPCRPIDKGAAQAATRQGVFAWLRPPSGALFTCVRGEPSAGLETCDTAGLEACATSPFGGSRAPAPSGPLHALLGNAFPHAQNRPD